MKKSKFKVQALIQNILKQYRKKYDTRLFKKVCLYEFLIILRSVDKHLENWTFYYQLFCIMTRKFKAIWISIFMLLMGIQDVNAFHIVGGEMTYECLGNNQYRIALTVYRDCNCGQCGDLDNPAHIFVFDAAGEYSIVEVELPLKDPVDPPTNLCIEDQSVLNSVCVEKGDYEIVLNLPPKTGGYDIVYQRYSRNITLDNINFPSQTGSTYMTHIPDPSLAICNSSPVFNEFPPTMICENVPFTLDQSAIDLDGDSLVYELCDPLIGGSDLCPTPGLFNEDSGVDCTVLSPPPYPIVTWRGGYSAVDPLGGVGTMILDAETGRLYGTPPSAGQYVVGICVHEYRNGELINTVRRDFQFNVVQCEASVAQVDSDDITAAGEYIFNNCNDYTINFMNTSIKANQFLWDFGDPNTDTDVSTEENPMYQYPDTGKYVGQLIAIFDGGSFICSDTAEIIVYMYPLVDAHFEAETTCFYDPVVFTNTSTSTYGNFQTFEWDFGDGNTSTDINPQHHYEEGGNYLVKLNAITNLGCEVGFEQEVYVVPEAAEFSTTLKCPGVPINFMNETSINTVSWRWDFGDPTSGTDNESTSENGTHIYSQPGDYTVNYYTESTEGCLDTATLSFTIYPEFLADVGADLEICFGDNISLSVTTDAGTETPYTYSWSPAASLDDPTLQGPNLNMDYEGPRNYTVEVRDPNGCVDSDQMEAFGLPLPEVNVPEDFTICFGDEIPLEGVVGSNVVSFEWSENNVMVNNIDLIPTFAPQINSIYLLSATDDKGCINSDEVNIEVIPAIEVDVSPDETICFGESIQLNAVSDGADSFVWSPPLTLDDANISNPTATPTESQVYVVSGINSCFTDVKDSVLITVVPKPVVDAGEDIVIAIGESATLNASGEWDFEWLPDSDLSSISTPNPTVSPLVSNTYYVVTTDDFGCQAMDSVQLIIENIFEVVMPTAFSPNRDGVNDIYAIGPTRGLKEVLEFKIFTRWGQEVFATNDVAEGWNGEVDFRPMGIGTYVYYVRALTLLDEELAWKGNLTLIR